MRFNLVALLLCLVFNTVNADTEVTQFSACGQPEYDFLPAVSYDPKRNQTVASVSFETDVKVIPFGGLVSTTDVSTSWISVDLLEQCKRLGKTTSFMARVSWPASHPVDADISIFRPDASSTTRLIQILLQNRGVASSTPHVANEVPLIITIERLIFGIPLSSLGTTVLSLLVSLAVVFWMIRTFVLPTMTRLAEEASREQSARRAD